MVKVIAFSGAIFWDENAETAKTWRGPIPRLPLIRDYVADVPIVPIVPDVQARRLRARSRAEWGIQCSKIRSPLGV